MMIETISAAATTANGLARPSKRISSAGSPKMLEPIIELMTRAVIDHRPIERIRGTEETPKRATAHDEFLEPG
jgi:hypothetical protein